MLVTATTVTAAVISAAEAGQEQDPDQPFTAVASATAVIAQQSATVVITAAATAEQ